MVLAQREPLRLRAQRSSIDAKMRRSIWAAMRRVHQVASAACSWGFLRERLTGDLVVQAVPPAV